MKKIHEDLIKFGKTIKKYFGEMSLFIILFDLVVLANIINNYIKNDYLAGLIAMSSVTVAFIMTIEFFQFKNEMKIQYFEIRRKINKLLKQSDEIEKYEELTDEI